MTEKNSILYLIASLALRLCLLSATGCQTISDSPFTPSDLPVIENMPNPFVTNVGQTVQTNADDWRTLAAFTDKIFFGKEPTNGKRFDQLSLPDAPRRYSWSAPTSP